MDENIYRFLGRRLREERTRAGLTLDRLGERAGITGAFISHIEAGRKNATLMTIGRLANALGLTVAELLSEPTRKNPAQEAILLLRIIRNKTPKQKRILTELLKIASALTR